MRPSGSGSPLVYSSGFYHVEGVPTISVLSPSEDGSADDFATVQLGNPWDMRDAADVERQGHITGGAITSHEPRDAVWSVRACASGLLRCECCRFSRPTAGAPVLRRPRALVPHRHVPLSDSVGRGRYRGSTRHRERIRRARHLEAFGRVAPQRQPGRDHRSPRRCELDGQDRGRHGRPQLVAARERSRW